MAKKILLVDDNRLPRMMVKAMINNHYPDWEVTEAANGDEAKKLVSEQAFDIVVMDYNMPGDDGVTVSSDILEISPDLKIALLTANVQSAVEERAEKLGLTFIAKPVKEDRVLPFLQEHAG